MKVIQKLKYHHKRKAIKKEERRELIIQRILLEQVKETIKLIFEYII